MKKIVFATDTQSTVVHEPIWDSLLRDTLHKDIFDQVENDSSISYLMLIAQLCCHPTIKRQIDYSSLAKH